MMLQVLLVDYNASERKKIADMIGACGHTVAGEAGNFGEALAWIERGWPTVVMTDLTAPHPEGLRLARYIYEQRLPIVTVMLSTYADFDAVRQAMRYGASDYLIKPVKREDVQRALERAERSVHYFCSAHQKLAGVQSFFTRLERMTPSELLKEQHELIQSLLLSQSDAQGMHMDGLRFFADKWRQVLGASALPVCTSSWPDTDHDRAAYVSQLAEVWIAHTYTSALGSRNVKLLFKMACDYIHENFRKDMTLPDMSRRFGMSDSYFSTQFKRWTGYSFVQYVNRIRIQKAKELLLEPDLKIYEVAYEVGYTTLQYFNRVFKQSVSISPIEYRKMMGI